MIVSSDSLVLQNDLENYFPDANVAGSTIQWNINYTDRNKHLGRSLNKSNNNDIGSLKIGNKNNDTLNFDFQLMGNLIFKVESGGNTNYQWVGFAHDPRMTISPE